MAKFSNIPTELILHIACFLSDQHDLNVLTTASRRFYGVLNPELYKRDANPGKGCQSKALAWAAEHGVVNVVRMALAAGSDVDGRYQSAMSMAQKEEARRRQEEDELGEEHEEEEDDDEVPKSEFELDPDINDYDDTADDIGVDPLAGPFWWTPLHVSLYKGHADIVDVLLAAGASLETSSRGLCECRALHRRILFRHEIALGRPRGAVDFRRMWRPLHVAICRGGQCVERLIDAAKAAPCRFLTFDRIGGQIGDLGDALDYLQPQRPSGGELHALHTAAFHGDIAATKALVDNGFKPEINTHTGEQVGLDPVDEFGLTPLWHASANRQYDAVEWLIKKGANIDAVAYNTTLFKRAIGRGRDVSRLLELGASTTSASDSLSLLLIMNRPYITSREMHRQVERQDRRLIDRLLKMGYPVDYPDPNGNTPLMIAITLLDKVALYAFLKAGADVHAKNRLGQSPLLLACFTWPVSEDQYNDQTALATIDLLLDSGAAVDQPILESNSTALLAVCANANTDTPSAASSRFVHHRLGVAKRLLERGADPNRRTGNGETALELAFTCWPGDIDICELLLEHGAIMSIELAEKLWVFAVDDRWVDGLVFLSGLGYPKLRSSKIPNGFNYLLRALEDNDFDDLLRLVELGVGPTTDISGENLLHVICGTMDNLDFSELIGRLRDCGLDINARRQTGETPLHIAVASDNCKLVGVLCEFGADPHISSPDIASPFELALDLELNVCPKPKEDLLKYQDEDVADARALDWKLTDREDALSWSSNAWRNAHSLPRKENHYNSEPSVFSVLLQFPPPARRDSDAGLHYLHSLAKLCAKPSDGRDTRRMYLYSRYATRLYRHLALFGQTPLTDQLAAVLVGFFKSLMIAPGWLESEEPNEIAKNNYAICTTIVLTISAFRELDPQSLYSPAGDDLVTPVDMFEKMTSCAREGTSAWQIRLGRAVAVGFVSVQMEHGRKVFVWAESEVISEKVDAFEAKRGALYAIGL